MMIYRLIRRNDAETRNQFNFTRPDLIDTYWLDIQFMKINDDLVWSDTRDIQQSI